MLQKTQRFAIVLSVLSAGLLTSCGANYASNPFVGENGTVYMGEGSYSAAGYRFNADGKGKFARAFYGGSADSEEFTYTLKQRESNKDTYEVKIKFSSSESSGVFFYMSGKRCLSVGSSFYYA